jgi:lysophospholipase L1-like esterase
MQEIENGVTHQHEVVHTHGWYLRQYVQQTKAKGAYPILMSLTPRNVWKDGHVEVGVSDYRMWARSVALSEGNTGFVDLSGIMAKELDRLGQEKASGLYHDMVHMRDAGAFLAAKYVVSGLKAMLDAPASRYLSTLGQMVTPADELAFHWQQNPKLPTLWLLGDSTVRNGDGTGIAGMWGWGDEIGSYLDPQKMNVTNVAVSGRSSRTYYTMHWPLVLPNIRRGDVVMLQFGHNDTGDPADPKRARGTLPGTGEEVKSMPNPITGGTEEVHTYGWYLRQMIADIRKAGAVPVICSPVPRNNWVGTKIRREAPVEWAREVARQQQVPFVDLNTRLAQQYESWGKERVTALFADRGTHTTKEGARIAAEAAIHELKKSSPDTLGSYLIDQNNSKSIHSDLGRN